MQTLDETYFVPEIDAVWEQIKSLSLGVGMPPWWDCNHYAVSAHVHIQNNNITDGAAWAFGFSFGTKFNKFPETHTVNICYSTSGIWFIDVQNNKKWEADPELDTIHTVNM